MLRSGRAQLAAWAERNLTDLIDAASCAVIEAVPSHYGDHDDQTVSVAELHNSVADNLHSLVAALGAQDAPLELTAPQETGRRRAHQGVPLPEVLRAYRISFATLWDAMVDHVHRSRQPALTESLIVTAGLMWRFTDEHAVALTEAYRAATAEILLAEQRRRSAVVEALLTGRPGPESGAWETGALLGLPPDGQLVVVAADTRGLAEESLPHAERHLADRGLVSGWRLTPAQQIGIVSFHPDQWDTLVEGLRDIASARTGVSPPYRALPDTPRALHLAQAALAGMPTGQVAVSTFDPSPLAALVVCEPTEGRRLAEHVLGQVLQQPSEDRDLLLQTLNAYLDHAGSAERAADILFCHPNTVRNRLRRIQELTGRSLTDPRDVAELTTAAYAMRLDSATALWAGAAQRPVIPRSHALVRRPSSNGG